MCPFGLSKFFGCRAVFYNLLLPTTFVLYRRCKFSVSPKILQLLFYLTVINITLIPDMSRIVCVLFLY